MWDIYLKATNEQNKQRLMDMDNGLVVTRGWQGEGEGRWGKRDQICGDRKKSNYGQ